MKFSRKLIFLAIILIVVSIISMYFGSVKTIEGAETCPAGATSSTSTDASGNVTFSCSTDSTSGNTVASSSTTTNAPAAASCTGIVCAPSLSTCPSPKKAYSNQTCCASQASKKTACQPK